MQSDFEKEKRQRRWRLFVKLFEMPRRTVVAMILYSEGVEILELEKALSCDFTCCFACLFPYIDMDHALDTTQIHFDW
jgi:hypothetical protein